MFRGNLGVRNAAGAVVLERQLAEGNVDVDL